MVELVRAVTRVAVSPGAAPLIRYVAMVRIRQLITAALKRNQSVTYVNARLAPEADTNS